MRVTQPRASVPGVDEVVAKGLAEVRATIKRCALDWRRHNIGDLPSRLLRQIKRRRHAVITFFIETDDDPPGSGDCINDAAELFFDDVTRRIVEVVHPDIPAAFIQAIGVTSPR